jgi:phospholipase/carboxylesterase
MFKYKEKKVDNADTLVFLLHGYSSSELDLIELADYLKTNERNISFISLRASEVCENYSGGYQWFSLKNISFPINKQNIERERINVMPIIERCSLNLIDFVNKKMSEYKIKQDRVFLLGFSQGATIVFSSALRMAEKIGGVIMCSGFIAENEDFFEKNNFCKQNILFLYGLKDNVIEQDSFNNSKYLLDKYLQNTTNTVVYKDLYHNINSPELECIKKYFFR